MTGGIKKRNTLPAPFHFVRSDVLRDPTGLTLRNQALFGRRSEKGVAQGVLYVNGDWKFRSYMTASDVVGSGLNSKVALSMNRVKNSSFNVPGTNSFWNYADTSTTVSTTLSHLVFEKFAMRGQYVFRNSHFGKSPTENDSSRADFLRNDTGGLIVTLRGLEDDWNDHIMAFGITRDTRNNQNIVLAGSDFGASWQYHFTDADHNFHDWQGSLTNYFKLGKEKYEISGDEERKAGGLSVKKVLEKMENVEEVVRYGRLLHLIGAKEGLSEARVTDALEKAGIQVRRVEAVPPSVEDIFVTFVGLDERKSLRAQLRRGIEEER